MMDRCVRVCCKKKGGGGARRDENEEMNMNEKSTVADIDVLYGFRHNGTTEFTKESVKAKMS